MSTMSSPHSPTSNSSNALNMAPGDRSGGRDVHVYDAKDPTTVLGGLILSNGVTNANLYSMMEIIVLFQSYFELRDENDTKVERNHEPLQPGKYYVHTTAPFTVNNETPLTRMLSQSTGTRIQSFRDTVRARDRRCVISGTPAVGAHVDDWSGFEAAHIFPLAYEGYWKENNYGRWIEIQPENGGSINSVQNGILLRSDIYCHFDNYNFSINPDDGYKVVFFAFDPIGLAGKHLDQEFINNPQRPIDQLLRWHLRQAILTNMKGAGEPRLEHDFPPSSNIVGEILCGPKPAERMEFELFNRLASQVEL